MSTNTTVKARSEDETVVAEYNSTSLRKFAAWYRSTGRQLPRLYYYLSSFPLRLEGNKKVLVEGRYSIGAKTTDGIISLAEIAAQGGYKIRTTAKSEAAAKELLRDLKAAINQTGKYAPAPKKIRGAK